MDRVPDLLDFIKDDFVLKKTTDNKSLLLTYDELFFELQDIDCSSDE